MCKMLEIGYKYFIKTKAFEKKADLSKRCKVKPEKRDYAGKWECNQQTGNNA
mgnify:FL=1